MSAESRKIYSQEHQRDNPEMYRLANKKSRLKLRQDVIDHYGGQCYCCGESLYQFLVLDKIGNGHRKWCEEQGIAFSETLRTLKKLGYPSGWQVLCSNCNQAKQTYGEGVACLCRVWRKL